MVLVKQSRKCQLIFGYHFVVAQPISTIASYIAMYCTVIDIAASAVMLWM